MNAVAFEDSCREIEERMTNYIRRGLSGRNLPLHYTPDLVADVLVIAFKKWETIAGGPYGYLYKTALNKMRNFDRKERRKRPLDDLAMARLEAPSEGLAESSTELPGPLVWMSGSFDDGMGNLETRVRIFLDGLPERQRAVGLWRLRFVKKNRQEVRRDLRASNSTLARTWKEVRAALRTYLSPPEHHLNG